MNKVCFIVSVWSPYGTFLNRKEYALTDDELDWVNYWTGKEY